MKNTSSLLAALVATGALSVAMASPSLAQPAGRGACAGTCASGPCAPAGPDLSRSVTVEGTAKSFAGGPGVGRPLLLLATTSGDREFVVAPYRALAVLGAVPAAGTRYALQAAPVTVDGREEWVVLRLTDLSTGTTTTLRDPETGIPVRPRGRGWGRGGATCNARTPSAG